jgi:hypothetical protein
VVTVVVPWRDQQHSVEGIARSAVVCTHVDISGWLYKSEHAWQQQWLIGLSLKAAAVQSCVPTSTVSIHQPQCVLYIAKGLQQDGIVVLFCGYVILVSKRK